MDGRYHIYIDEAGDEGFGKLRDPGRTGQSRWLALGAIIVTAENDRLLPQWRDAVMRMFPDKKKRDLHFRKLSHAQKVAACNYLREKPIGCCVILSNKTTIIDSGKSHIFKQKGYLYNYLVRFLLERVSDACALKTDCAGFRPEKAIVTFSRRAGTDYHDMKDYLYLLKCGREKFKSIRDIDWRFVDPEKIYVENHEKRAGLQIADAFTSATAAALEPNAFGFCEPRYATILKERYVKLGGSLLNSGITLVPTIDKNPLSEEQSRFIDAIGKE